MQKIVFNAHYLMYFDTAVADYWRALAMPYEEAMHQLDGDLYVKKATVEFHASARMDDRLDVGLRCSRIGNSSMLFQGAIFRGEDLLITCELVYVFADPATQTSRPVPQALRDTLLPASRPARPWCSVQTGPWDELGGGRAAASAPRCSCRSSASRPSWNGTRPTPAPCTRWPTTASARPMATGRLLPATRAASPRSAAWPCTRCCAAAASASRCCARWPRRRSSAATACSRCTRSARARDFYARLGFQPEGEPFEEAGIPHLTMTSALPLAR